MRTSPIDNITRQENCFSAALSYEIFGEWSESKVNFNQSELRRLRNVLCRDGKLNCTTNRELSLCAAEPLQCRNIK